MLILLIKLTLINYLFKKCLLNKLINTKKFNQRLELQYEESKNYLNDLIQMKPYTESYTPSIEKMGQAYNKLKAHFRSYLTVGLKNLTDFLDYFLSNIELVVIESENLSSALKIFETINQRGAGLNAMDLVKNLLFSKANETDFQNIKQIWKSITANLSACNEDSSPLRFLRYFLMARYHNGIIREDDIYKWIISNEGKSATKYETQPLEFAKELKVISDRYAKLVIATESVKDGSNYPNITNIGFINKYKSRLHLILLLALDQACSIIEIEYLGEQIESFLFFSNSLGIEAKNNERFFAQWAVKLRGVKTLEDVQEIISSTILPYISEKIPSFKTAFLNISHRAYHPLYRLRYVLGKMENTIRIKAGLPGLGHNFIESLQIEHIFPQTPKDGILPEVFVDKDEYHGIVYKLGNVTLLESSINQAVNNFNELKTDWFNKKLEEYVKSNVVSTNLLDSDFLIGKNTQLNKFKNDFKYSFETWTPEDVQNRQRVFLELAFETWKINGQRVDKIYIKENDQKS
jgi:hypothetical protein